MNVKTIIEPVTRAAYKVYGKVLKHSPEILLGSGLTAMVAGAVIAVEKTMTVEPIVTVAEEKLRQIREAEQAPDISYSKQDKGHDLVQVYVSTGAQLAKHYWTSVALECVGVACILSSYGIMRSRNAALTAAYTALERGFNEYRQRVRDTYGEEEDRYFRTGLRTKEIEIKERDESGNETTKTVEAKVFDPDHAGVSTFARWFDETNDNYVNSSTHNLSFLTSIQKLANRSLQRNGYIFLNDVYDMLGIPRCQQGQAVGWLRDTDKGGGQGFVDFGIYDGYRASCRDFVNGYEKKILLDFNIDPVPIWDQI